MFRKRTASLSISSTETLMRRKIFRVRAALCVLSGLMLGLSFPPSPFGILACFGLVPLLIVLADIDEIGTGLRYGYLAMLVFHVITLNWTGGFSHANDVYMMLAGTATMIIHPLFYFIPLAVYLFVKKYLGHGMALGVLPFAWTGYEYSHTLTQWSFPWLTLGNSQSYDLSRIQFISVTGILGLSFWIVCLNVLAFVLYSSIARSKVRRIPRESWMWAAVIAALYVAPAIYGRFVLSNADDVTRNDVGSITVGIVQANVDPWEKWAQSGYRTIEEYMDLTGKLLAELHPRKPDLVLWPETAVPYYILTPANHVLLDDFHARVDQLDVAVLTGLPHAVFYDDARLAPPTAKKVERTGQRYDAFNASALFEPGVSDVPWYGKMKMVPLAERVPYAEWFHFLGFLQWGVGIGGWQIGPGPVVFTERRTGARFCTPICYESVYPGYVAEFVRKGAQFIAVITIDSWWGKMSGAYQHQRFAIFRAIENRRWVARCAVGGISCYIDPYGRVFDSTELFTQRLLSRTIGLRDDLTTYTRLGDWLGDLSLFAAGLVGMAAVGRKFFNQHRERQWQNNS